MSTSRWTGSPSPSCHLLPPLPSSLELALSGVTAGTGDPRRVSLLVLSGSPVPLKGDHCPGKEEVGKGEPVPCYPRCASSLCPFGPGCLADPWVLPVVGLNLAALCCPPRRAAPATDPLLAAVAGSLPRTTSLVPSASSPRTTPATSHWSSIPARRMTRRSCRRPPSLAPPR